MPDPILVFVSYTHKPDGTREKVRGLVDRLRSEGVDAIFDQMYEDEPPVLGWPRWMEEEIKQATYVLVVCNEVYVQRFAGHASVSGGGSGAIWEGGIITQELYDAQGKNSKFIPVLLSDNDSAHIPSPLRATTYYFLEQPDGYDKLYYRITGQKGYTPPPLGAVRVRGGSSPNP